MTPGDAEFGGGRDRCQGKTLQEYPLMAFGKAGRQKRKGRWAEAGNQELCVSPVQSAAAWRGGYSVSCCRHPSGANRRQNYEL